MRIANLPLPKLQQMLKHLGSITSMLLTCGVITIAEANPNSQSLLDIYNLALAHDPTLASALSSNKAAQELIEQGKALYRPTVNFSAGANISRVDVQYLGKGIPFPNNATSYESYQYGVEARQPLFRKQNLVLMAQLQIQVSQADKQWHLAQQNLMLRTSQSFFDVLLAQDKLALLTAQKAAIVEQLAQAQSNYDVGSATITDTNEAQARYDLILAQEIAAQNEVAIAKNAVQAVTGELPQTFAKVKATLKAQPLATALPAWLEVARENNLAIQIQQETAKLATQAIEHAQAEHLPTLDAVANYTESYANGSAFGFGNDLSSGSIGLQLQVPIYQGGATSSRIRQATLNKQKALDDVEVARRQTEQETQRAYLNLNSSIAQLSAYEQALISSQSQLESTQTGYEVGVRTSVDVLNAQQQLFSAKRDLLQARYQYLLNIIRLKAIAGIINETDLNDINQQLELMPTAVASSKHKPLG